MIEVEGHAEVAIKLCSNVLTALSEECPSDEIWEHIAALTLELYEIKISVYGEEV